MQMNRNDKTKNHSKSKKATQNHSFFIREYKWWIIIPLSILIVGYVLIYICFLGHGFLPVGMDLEKKDWLAFLGTYLSFAGTLIISLIAILQNRFFVEKEKEHIAADRKKNIQPILSVRIVGTNTQITT